MRDDQEIVSTLESRQTRDSAATRRNILEVATRHFAAKGYSGARIDEIAAETATSKRMIYYNFADKEDLFVAVLEHAYSRIRGIESGLNLEDLTPDAAISELVGFTFDYQNANPDFIRLVMIENIHEGRHIAKSKAIRSLNISVIAALERICERGQTAGLFRPDIDVIDLHMTISALCVFNVANRATFSVIFQRDMASPDAVAARKAQVVDTVLRSVLARFPLDSAARI